MVIYPGTVFSASRDYPNRQIEVVVPFAPGGSSDLSARIFSDGLSKRLGVSIVVSNKTGGSGAAGAEYVANAKPDGYILTSAVTPLTILPHQVKTAFTYKDFEPVINVVDDPSMFLISRMHPGRLLPN
jgi:tripartite-type tricarboxylate transporter receptor subunit TctC